MPLAARLYLPPDDSSALKRQHVWYQALPVLLHVIANAVICFYVVYASAVLAVLGRLFALLFGRCVSPAAYVIITVFDLVHALLCGSMIIRSRWDRAIYEFQAIAAAYVSRGKL